MKALRKRKTVVKDTAPVPPVGRSGAEGLDTASPWQLMWRKFRKHRVALVSLQFLGLLYVTAAFCEVVAPYPLENTGASLMVEAPPQRVRFGWVDGAIPRPYVYGLTEAQDPDTLRWIYREDRSRRYAVRWFVRGAAYRFWGLFGADLHLFGVDRGGSIHLLGTDSMGQCVFSRVLYGARISLTVGLLGVAMSLMLGLLIGAASGYYGGRVDGVIQRGIEILRAFPTIPLWMALSAALPRHWSPLRIYFGITVVLSLVSWTGLAREIRGKVMSLRNEDFVVAARLYGARPFRLMTRHLLPACWSHAIVSLTLTIPGMILGETALSFLGLGLKPPITSWGVLLKEAQNIQAVAMSPWLLTPALFVILTVFAFNFVGDGMRDAADPYAR